MKIKPVEHIKTPEYPDIYSPESKTAVISARPRRWLNKPLAVSLSAAIAAGLGGCAYTTDGDPAQIPAYPNGTQAGQQAGQTGESAEYVTMGEPMTIPVHNEMYVPLFEFGNGTGSIGCVMVAPPSFMSEEEAFEVLKSVFEQYGLLLDKSKVMYANAEIPITEIYSYEEKTMETQISDLQVYSVDGVGDNLYVKFVNRDDVIAWQTENPEYFSSVESYNMKSAAQAIAGNNQGIAVFYDPGSLYEYNEETEQYENINDREALLRSQAEAFIDWLKEEGLL